MGSGNVGIKISNALTGKPKSDAHKINISKALKGNTLWNKGISMSEDAKEKLRITLKKRKARSGFKLSEEHKRKLREAKLNKPNLYLKGRKRPDLTGPKHFRWTGKSDENKLIRNSIEYKQWRTAVFERDNYKCVQCGKGGNINADHILRFSDYPNLRFDLKNGQTLCVTCHRKKTKSELKITHKNQHGSWDKNKYYGH